jgi:hypothetical protein
MTLENIPKCKYYNKNIKIISYFLTIKKIKNNVKIFYKNLVFRFKEGSVI